MIHSSESLHYFIHSPHLGILMGKGISSYESDVVHPLRTPPRDEEGDECSTETKNESQDSSTIDTATHRGDTREKYLYKKEDSSEKEYNCKIG